MDTLKSLLGDGAGNISLMRVVILLVIVAIIATKFYNAKVTGQLVEWTSTDWALISTLIGGKIIQNNQENKP